MWKDNLFGNEFKDEEAVYDDAIENMDVEDYIEFGNFDIKELLSIVFQNSICDDVLEDKIEEARSKYIDWYYDEIEDESEEE